MQGGMSKTWVTGTVTSSSGLDCFGQQKAITFLLTTGMIIKSFITDRHGSITKGMRESCPKICKDWEKL